MFGGGGWGSGVGGSVGGGGGGGSVDLTAIEERLTQLESKDVVIQVQVDDLSMSVNMLKDQVQGNTNTGGDDPGMVGDVAALESQIVLLRATVTSLETTVTDVPNVYATQATLNQHTSQQNATNQSLDLRITSNEFDLGHLGSWIQHTLPQTYATIEALNQLRSDTDVAVTEVYNLARDTHEMVLHYHPIIEG